MLTRIIASTFRNLLDSFDDSAAWRLKVDESSTALEDCFPTFDKNIALALIYILHMRRDTDYRLDIDSKGHAKLSPERIVMVRRFDEWIRCDCDCGSTWNFAKDGGLQDKLKNNRPCLVAKWLSSSLAEQFYSKIFPSKFGTGKRLYYSTLKRWCSIDVEGNTKN
jgi:hypothetical protein